MIVFLQGFWRLGRQEKERSVATLSWVNKEENLKKAVKNSATLLKVNLNLSYGDQEAENMLIQGDNLEALQALLPTYAGQVKCIFIDPPYNTRKTFDHYKDSLHHSQWLEMMYLRLEVLREILAEDGSIWVTIDDNESHYLKVLMDEIFGRKNFLANCIWQKKCGPCNDTQYFSAVHDHILAFAKNKKRWKPNLLKRSDQMNAKYTNPDHDPRGVWHPTNLSAKTFCKRNTYPIVSPLGKEFLPPATRSWVVSEEKYQALLADNRIWFGAKGNTRPYKKTYLSEVLQGAVPTTLWLHSEAGHNAEAKHEAKVLNGEDVFTTPKPERLLQRILHLATHENDLVLDSFLGSGTTAAVAHKMKRRYIGIEKGEHVKTHCAPRLQKVIDGEQGGISQEVNWQGGGGYRFYTLTDSLLTDKRIELPTAPHPQSWHKKQDVPFPFPEVPRWVDTAQSLVLP